MEFTLNINIPHSAKQINHQHKILSIGSCFTENIGNTLMEMKFQVMQNPNGILFDPVSVSNSLISYIRNKQYGAEDLFYLDEIWHSWHYHSRFSGTDRQKVLNGINASQKQAHTFLKEADWLIITLGSAFSYKLTQEAVQATESVGTGVANCHRAPAQWFKKHLLTIEEIVTKLDNTIHQLFHFNPKLNIIFTISPVRHIRDGVVDNNRSKARLIEAVHHMVNKFDKLHYFPSYELVIDVLRDYRFYDIDLVHPNYLATDFVLQQFMATYMSEATRALMQELKKISIARKHRPSHPDTEAHARFLESNLEKLRVLQQQHPYLDLEEELILGLIY